MLETTKYNLGREYEFYIIVSSDQRRKGGTAIPFRKEIPHKRLIIRTILQIVALEVYLAKKGQKKYAQYVSPNRPGE